MQLNLDILSVNKYYQMVKFCNFETFVANSQANDNF